MSGVAKSVGKVFKKVAKVAKKVAPYALAAAAIYFTAGAALGVAGTAGGWGAAVSSLTSNMGATGMLGNILTGAITQAGYGAALGGLTAGLTGKDIGKGAMMGAAGGAVTGGAMGGFGLPTDPLAGIGSSSAPASGVAGGPGVATGGPINLNPAAGPTGVALAGPSSAGVNLTPAATWTGNSVNGANGGGLFTQGGWVERNGALLGQAAGGLGQGIIGLADSQGDAESGDRRAELWLARDQAERDAITANYSGAGAGLLTPENMAYLQGQPQRPTPAQRFDPATYGGQYVYDPQLGRIVLQRTAAA